MKADSGKARQKNKDLSPARELGFYKNCMNVFVCEHLQYIIVTKQTTVYTVFRKSFPTKRIYIIERFLKELCVKFRLYYAYVVIFNCAIVSGTLILFGVTYTTAESWQQYIAIYCWTNVEEKRNTQCFIATRFYLNILN